MTTHPAYARFRTVALATAMALTLGPGGFLPVAGQAWAMSVKKGGPSVTLNFVNAEIEGVARAMGAIVNLSLIHI